MKVERFPAWLRMVVVSILVFLIGYGLIALEAWQKGVEGPGRPSSYSTGSHGFKALYLWLKDLGIPVERWEKPLGEIPSEVTVLLMVQPEMGPNLDELKTLGTWVQNGGTLIIASMPPDPFMNHFGLEGKAIFHGQDKEEPAKKLTFQPGGYIRGEPAIQSEAHPGLISQKPGFICHVADVWGGLIGALKEGEGRVIAIADPFLFSNQSLRKGDHARLVLDLLLAHLGAGVLAVDEYHHGYGRATTVLGHLARSRAFEPLLQGLVLLLILWLAKGRRFGVPRPPVVTERRFSMDYVRAMAELFRRGQARNHALETNLKWCEEEARKLVIDGDGAFRKTLQSVREHLRSERMTDRELLSDTQRLYQALERAKRAAPGGGKG